MKPIMQIDSTLPNTRQAPIHPETGQPWHEKDEELMRLSLEWQFAEEEDKKEALQAYWDARRGVKLRDTPYFCENKIFCGPAALANRGVPEEKIAEILDEMKNRRCYGCHPETWALFSEEEKEKFVVEDVDKLRGKTITFTTSAIDSGEQSVRD